MINFSAILKRLRSRTAAYLLCPMKDIYSNYFCIQNKAHICEPYFCPYLTVNSNPPEKGGYGKRREMGHYSAAWARKPRRRTIEEMPPSRPVLWYNMRMVLRTTPARAGKQSGYRNPQQP